MSQFDLGTGPHDDPYGQPEDQQEGGGTNVLGIVGLVLAFCLPPLGLILSLIALTRRPRGFAIAGTVVGLILTGVLGALIGAGIWATNQQWFQWQQETQVDFIRVQQEINQGGGTPPATLGELGLPEAVTTDAFGNPYVYTTDGSSWSLTTLGPDGVADTADDLELDGDLEPFDLGFAFNRVMPLWQEAADQQQSGGAGQAEDAGDADAGGDAADDGAGEAPASDPGAGAGENGAG